MDFQAVLSKTWMQILAVVLIIMGFINLHNSRTFGNALSVSDAGQILEASGNTRGAIGKYQESVRLHPQAAYFFALLGNAYHKIGENDKALAAYESALKRSPRHFWVHYLIGNLYLDEHRYTDAIHKYNELVSMDDNWYQSNKVFHYTQYQNLAWGQLGYCYLKLGEKQKALEAYQQYLIKNPAVKDRKLVENFIQILSKKEDGAINAVKNQSTQ